MNGKETKAPWVMDFKYARAGGDFGWESKRIGKNGRQSVFEAQKERNAPAAILVFTDKGEKSYIKAAHALAASGVSVIEKGETDGSVLFYHIIADSSGIPWFAYNQ
jgi:hypothetical protein